jgi:CTP:molybdopterin cytidylyltransferase MocA
VFAASYFPKLMAMPESEGAKRILAAAGDDLRQVPMPQAAVDVDEPPDYQKLMAE